jgi:hypothetical protein
MAGAGYKLFNTGDVLTAAQVNTYLMEQSVMVFADAAARTTALTGVVAEGMLSYLKDTNAVEVYDGANWVASDDPNAIQNTIVDAKGDLISATAADTPARLAVGNNGETLVADSSTATGLDWKTAAEQYPWTAYTPSTAGLTLGNGVLTGRYQQIGKTVNIEVDFLFGSTSAVTGLIKFSIPVNIKLSGFTGAGVVSFGDSGVGNYMGTAAFESATTFYVGTTQTSGAYAFEVATSATVPFTWTTNDRITIRMTYEAA